MGKPRLRVVGSTIVNRTVTPRRKPNADLRTREYLTPDEIEKLIEAVRNNRHGHRDATVILIAYRHGLRAAELVDLRWSQVDLDNARLHVRRVKYGVPSVHPLKGDEMRALRRLKRETENSEYVFVSERGSPFTTAGFAKLVERAGLEAGFKFGRTRTCCGIPAATSLLTTGMTQGRCRPISGTRTSNTQCAIPRCRRRGSRIFGAIDLRRSPGRFKTSGASRYC